MTPTPIVPAMKPSASDERGALINLIFCSPTDCPHEDAVAIADAILAAGFHRDPGWIACSERMPEDSRRCLVAVNVIGDWHSQVIAHWMANPLPGTIAMPVWQVPGGSAVLGLVTHWMPLPPAPDDNEAPHV